MRERGEEESKSDYDNVDDDGDAAPRVSHGRPSRLTCFRGSSGSEGGNHIWKLSPVPPLLRGGINLTFN